MVPALQPGQDVLSFNWAYLGTKPKVGDIVVVKVNGKDMVKRVNKVYDRTVYLQGDNREESADSRDFGVVSMNQIIGKVVYTTERHPELVSGSDEEMLKRVQHDKWVDCPKCGSPVLGIYGRKDAICQNCGFKLACCGEP